MKAMFIFIFLLLTGYSGIMSYAFNSFLNDGLIAKHLINENTSEEELKNAKQKALKSVPKYGLMLLVGICGVIASLFI